ncbi:MAG: hypothetical protein DI582_05800 [Azospirillum brasilense]|nr:MAG: hypothetical protein DI582_05800 [Azospirillum brasilense]
MSAPARAPSVALRAGSPVGASLPDAAHGTSRNYSSTTYSNYLFGRAGESQLPLWSDTFRGRAAIRLVSRGIVGAAAMTMVDRATRLQLGDYNPTTAKFGENGIWHDVALGIDKTLTRGIRFGLEKGAGWIGGMEAGAAKSYAQSATTFRQKSYYHSHSGQPVGRSLGAEMVAVTAGFSAASFGDATVRNLIQMVDPNSAKSWMVNDAGDPAKPGEKRHFDFGKWVNATARTTWRIATKNAGEDWAVALPYVYQMRWQRGLLSKMWPDSKLGLDNGMNGGSLYFNKEGQVIGDFQAAGAVDFHARFVGYNWYTLMFREAYDAVGRQLKGWKDKDFSLDVKLPENPISSAISNVGYGARYVAKSFIKANLYMNPAVVPFWAVRVSQSKWRASPVLQDQESMRNAFGSIEPTSASHLTGATDGGHQHLYDSLAKGYPQDPGLHLHGKFEGPVGSTIHFDSNHTANGSMFGKRGGVYSWEACKQQMSANKLGGLFSTLINPFGWASYQAGGGATKLTDRFMPNGHIDNFLSKGAAGASQALGARSARREQFVRTFVDNSFAYTPYMIAKAETALRVDERSPDGGLGDMDKAIYKLIDSTVKFDMKGVGNALGTIKAEAMDMGREVKMREGDDPLVEAAKKRAAHTPTPVVQGPSVSHVGLAAAHAPVVQAEKATAADENKDEKRWADSVTGRSLAGRFQQGQHTLH